LVTADNIHPFYICDSRTGDKQGFSTLEQAREALLGWILLQRQAGETVVEHENGQWSDSRVTRWIANLDDEIVPLDTTAMAGASPHG
jgi:hypothetical protein